MHQLSESANRRLAIGGKRGWHEKFIVMLEYQTQFFLIFLQPWRTALDRVITRLSRQSLLAQAAMRPCWENGGIRELGLSHGTFLVPRFRPDCSTTLPYNHSKGRKLPEPAITPRQGKTTRKLLKLIPRTVRIGNEVFHGSSFRRWPSEKRKMRIHLSLTL